MRPYRVLLPPLVLRTDSCGATELPMLTTCKLQRSEQRSSRQLAVSITQSEIILGYRTDRIDEGTESFCSIQLPAWEGTMHSPVSGNATQCYPIHG